MEEGPTLRLSLLVVSALARPNRIRPMGEVKGILGRFLDVCHIGASQLGLVVTVAATSASTRPLR